MWDVFETFVAKKYTVTRIRLEMLNLGYDLSPYSDVVLIKKMLVV